MLASRRILLLLAAASLLVGSATGAATTEGALYGAAHPGGPGSPSTLYLLCPQTGESFAVGPIGFDAVNGLEVDPLTSTIYGIGKRTTDEKDVLITIDPLTGAGSEVGPLENTASWNGGGHFDLSFRESDLQLFLTAFRPADPCVSLFRIDTATGLATEVGDTFTCSPGNALGFDENDTLYHANKDGGGTLFTLDATTGHAVSSQALTFVSFPPLTNPRANALEFVPGSPEAFAVINDGLQGGGPNYLARIDPTSGAVEQIGVSVDGLAAVAWSPAGLFAFGTIRARSSKDGFEWLTAVHHEYVRGGFAASAEIASYGFDLFGSDSGAMLIDPDLPTTGLGSWYLLRHGCPEASWSSGGAGECPSGSCPEGDRDDLLP